VPRHAKVYRNFAAEYDRLQLERVAAFKAYADDVTQGVYPQPQHQVSLPPEELAAFQRMLPN
jgi:3-methyl-2-oxobutanoate hydroxymethyltransferase